MLHENTYSVVAKMVKDVLSIIIATSAPAEVIFESIFSKKEAPEKIAVFKFLAHE